MDDNTARELLGLLYDYVTLNAADMHGMTISELASDLAMSMDVTTDMDDQMRRYIEMSLA